MTYRNPFLTSIIRDMIDIRKEGIPPEINLRTTSLLLLFLQLLLLPFLNLVMLFSINKVPQNNPFSFLFVKIYVKVWASLLDLRISKLHWLNKDLLCWVAETNLLVRAVQCYSKVWGIHKFKIHQT